MRIERGEQALLLRLRLKRTLAPAAAFAASMSRRFASASDAKATLVAQLMYVTIGAWFRILPLPRFYAVERVDDVSIASVIGSLNADGY